MPILLKGNMVCSVYSSTGFIYRPWQVLDVKFEIVRSGKSSKKTLDLEN